MLHWTSNTPPCLFSLPGTENQSCPPPTDRRTVQSQGHFPPEPLLELEWCWADSSLQEVTEWTSWVNRPASRCACVSGSWNPTFSPPWFQEPAEWVAWRPVSCVKGKKTHTDTAVERWDGEVWLSDGPAAGTPLINYWWPTPAACHWQAPLLWSHCSSRNLRKPVSPPE